MTKPQLTDIPVELLQRGKYQPREHFAEAAITELADSIKINGLVQPIVVRPLANNRYEIVAGERRWRAAQLAGLETIACLVHYYSDEQAAEVTAVENINRVDLNPIEESQAYQRLIDNFSYTHDEIAAVIGKSRSHITNALRLLTLAPAAQVFLRGGQLSVGHGKVLAAYPEYLHKRLAETAVSKEWSVRKLAREAKLLADGDAAGVADDPNLTSLNKALADHLSCPVNIRYSGRKGEVAIAFQNIDVLQGILDKMGFDYSEF